MASSWRGHWPLGLLLFVFVALASFYNVANPIFEAPDELWHFQFVRVLAAGGGLPVLQEDPEQNVAGQEGGQPPLYHLLAALAISWIDTSDFLSVSIPSPYLQRIGAGPNVVVHSAREDFPYHGATLAVHVDRFLSTVIGAGTVLLTYLLALETLNGNKRLALGAAAITAFIPEFLFLSASINNDNLIIMVSALALFLSVRALNRGLGPGGALALGLTLAAAPLTKVSGAALAPLAFSALGLRAWRERSLLPLRPVLLLAPMAAAASGWWLIRNWSLYGDPLGLKMFIAAAGGDTPILTPERLWAEAHGIWVSTWALFGWSNLEADPALYTIYGAICLISLLGIARLVRNGGRHERILSRSFGVILVLWTVTFMALVAQYMRMISGMQGRLFFPALPAIAVLLIAGMGEMAPRGWASRWTGVLGVLLFLPALLAPILYIVPAYSQVGLLSEEQISSIPHRVDVRYGDSIELLGYRMDRREVGPGQPLEITLYWQALVKPTRDYTVFIHAFDAWGNALGGFDGLLGKEYPTAAWLAGSALEETYLIDLAEPQDRPSAVRIEVGLYPLSSSTRLPAYDAQGRSVVTAVAVAMAKAKDSAAQPPAAIRQETRLEDGLALAGYEIPATGLHPGQVIEGRLWWKAETAPNHDYTVFVQLIGPGGLVSQYDAKPRANSYPTSVWDAGEVVQDFFRLSVPPGAEVGTYRLIAGMYDVATGIRLRSNGIDHIVLGELYLTRIPSVP
ncbi:MAG: glycosyltransferase family 39 protein [Dehalococcoidia bacterium]|nr:glycosyltransferase family 39 protein [Dehalococcoidia bacterium]